MSAHTVSPAIEIDELLAAVGDAGCCWDLDSDRIGWAGGLAGVALDPDADLATGGQFAARIHPDDLAHRRGAVAAHLAEGVPFDCAYRLRDRAGRFVAVHERGQAQRDEAGRPRRLLTVLRVASDAARDRAGNAFLDYDGLTGHLNRTRLREAVDSALGMTKRAQIDIAFLVVALDGLAEAASRFGRQRADSLLIETGRLLDRCVRVSDVVGRLGPDRFGIVLAPCPADHVHMVADKIIATVREHSVAESAETGAVEPTVSVGSVAVSDGRMTSYQVMTAAERALAAAMQAGGDRHMEYGGATTRSRQVEGTVELVQTALRDRRVGLAFQPVVSVVGGAVDYYECLLRVCDAQGRTVPADDIVPALEQFGLIRLVDHFVLDRTLQELTDNPEIRLGLNISALTTADHAWLRQLLAGIRGRRDIAARLVVEITETAALYDIEQSVRFVVALREAGCRVALDDFGAGHTSLRHLQRVPVDTVKIDGSLVRSLDSDPDSRILLQHLLGLAQGFNFDIVAECIETPEQAEIVKAAGVGFLQGFHYGRPTLDRPWVQLKA